MRRIIFATIALLWAVSAANAQLPLTGAGAGAPGGAAGLMLDGVSNVIRAYSTARKLATAYAGNAMTIQETTGHTTQTVGFTGSPPVVNTSTINTFCSGKTCVIKVLNDQSGNGRDCSQSTEASMPIIFQSGAINTLNSQPAALGNITGLFCDNATSGNPSTSLWMNGVVVVSDIISAHTIHGSPTAGALQLRVNTSGNLELLKSNVASIGTSSGTLTAGTAATEAAQYDGTNFTFWLNGSTSGTGTNAQTLTAGNYEFESKASGGEPWVGSIAEVIEIDPAPSAGTISAIQTSQKSFYATP